MVKYGSKQDGHVMLIPLGSEMESAREIIALSFKLNTGYNII